MPLVLGRTGCVPRWRIRRERLLGRLIRLVMFFPRGVLFWGDSQESPFNSGEASWPVN